MKKNALGQRFRAVLPGEEKKGNDWCHYVVNGKCGYPDIMKNRGYCWSSTKCELRPYFPYHREDGLHGCTPPGGR